MKRIWKNVLLCALMIASIFLTACGVIDIPSFKYKLEFMLDGEVYKTVGTDGSQISMPKDPKKANFEFKGWFWDDGEWDEPFTINSILEQPIKEENFYKVYAKMLGKEVKVNLHCQDQTDGVFDTQKTIRFSSNYELPILENKDASKSFAGWNSQEDGNGKQLTGANGVSLEKCSCATNFDAYAQWEQRTQYKIYYDYNGATDNNSKQFDYIYSQQQLTLVVPQKTGATFCGWLEKNTGRQLTSSDGKMQSLDLASDIYAVANFQNENYVVTLDFQLARAYNGKNEVTTTLGANFTADSCARHGYKPDGWYSEKGGMGKKYVDKENVSVAPFDKTHDITIYANWLGTEGIEYRDLTATTCAVVGFHGKSNESSYDHEILAIPDYNNGKKVVSISNGSFTGLKFDCIYIGSNVEEISDGAFTQDTISYFPTNAIYFYRVAPNNITKFERAFGNIARVEIYVFEDFDAPDGGDLELYKNQFKKFYMIEDSQFKTFNNY